MKKIISLLLVTVLALGMLSGMTLAVDMPMESTQADAGIVVTHTGDPSAKYYFETLTQDVIKWACAELKGQRTVTVLKDLTLSNDGETGSTFLQIPKENKDWYGGKNPGNDLIDFDLGGHTISYTGHSNLFRSFRFGFEVKNGTIFYKGLAEGKGRGPFNFGSSGCQVAPNNGQNVYPTFLKLKDLNVYNLTESGGFVITNYLHGTQMEIENCLLWNVKYTNISFNKSNQKDVEGIEKITPYTGPYAVSLTVKDSVIGSLDTYPVSPQIEGTTVSISDSVIISPKATMVSDKCVEIDTNGQDVAEKENWTYERNGITLSGKGFVIGSDPTQVELPFEDVKESDWFHSFVSELYGKKIIAGQTATTFNPNGNLTYAAALKLLVVGLTGKDPGNASGSHWAANYLKEATTAGWTAIGAEKLDAPITREAFCEIAAKAKNLTEQPAENKFTDTTNTAVLALVKAGVINGMNETTFAPANVLTRAQISKIISLLLKL